MDKITIKTNNHERKLFSLSQLTVEEQAEFDYINSEPDFYSLRLFKYRGAWYDYYEFQQASEFIMAEGWNAVQPESHFSAVLVRFFTHEGEHMNDTIVVGYAQW